MASQGIRKGRAGARSGLPSERIFGGEPDRTTSPGRAVEGLRRAIVQGDLLPGDHVRQPDWSERLRVSRPVLREAFKILTAQKLLRHDPRRGYFITRLSTAELHDLYRLRTLLEREVLLSVEWPDERKMAALEHSLSRHVEQILSGDISGAVESYRTYSFTLFDLSPLAVTVDETKRLWEMSLPYRAVVLAIHLTRDPDLRHIHSVRAEQMAALAARDHDALARSFSRDRWSNLEEITEAARETLNRTAPPVLLPYWRGAEGPNRLTI